MEINLTDDDLYLIINAIEYEAEHDDFDRETYYDVAHKLRKADGTACPHYDECKDKHCYWNTGNCWEERQEEEAERKCKHQERMAKLRPNAEQLAIMLEVQREFDSILSGEMTEESQQALIDKVKELKHLPLSAFVGHRTYKYDENGQWVEIPSEGERLMYSPLYINGESILGSFMYYGYGNKYVIDYGCWDIGKDIERLKKIIESEAE